MKKLWHDVAGAAIAEIALGLTLVGAAAVVASIGLNGAIKQAVSQDGPARIEQLAAR
jgi:Flp pilus assembly pilin Flp